MCWKQPALPTAVMNDETEVADDGRLEQGLINTGPNFLKANHHTELGERYWNEFSDVVDAWPSSSKLPLVYSNGYNISFWGLARLQQLDSSKFERVVVALQKAGLLSRDRLVCPKEATVETLSDVHTQEYLSDLENSRC